LVAAPPALIRAGIETLPSMIAAAGAHMSERFIEFFTANIRTAIPGWPMRWPSGSSSIGVSNAACG
jgi:hypothetical protein